jgi:hypothetical protein
MTWYPSDATSTFSTAVEMIQLETTASLFVLDTTLIGPAGAATIAYRMMVYPLDPGDYSPF